MKTLMTLCVLFGVFVAGCASHQLQTTSTCEMGQEKYDSRRNEPLQGVPDEEYAARFNSFAFGGIVEYSLKQENGKLKISPPRPGEEGRVRIIDGCPEICPSLLPPGFTLKKHASVSWIFYGDEAALQNKILSSQTKWSVDIWRLSESFASGDFVVYQEQPPGYPLSPEFRPQGTDPMRVSTTNRGIIIWSGQGTILNRKDGTMVSLTHPDK